MLGLGQHVVDPSGVERTLAAEDRLERSTGGLLVELRKHVRLVEIAELLGVTKQRAHQLATERGFPVPGRDGRGVCGSGER
jgi:hypothetical protein